MGGSSWLLAADGVRPLLVGCLRLLLLHSASFFVLKSTCSLLLLALSLLVYLLRLAHWVHSRRYQLLVKVPLPVNGPLRRWAPLHPSSGAALVEENLRAMGELSAPYPIRTQGGIAHRHT